MKKLMNYSVIAGTFSFFVLLAVALISDSPILGHAALVNMLLVAGYCLALYDKPVKRVG